MCLMKMPRKTMQKGGINGPIYIVMVSVLLDNRCPQLKVFTIGKDNKTHNSKSNFLKNNISFAIFTGLDSTVANDDTAQVIIRVIIR